MQKLINGLCQVQTEDGTVLLVDPENMVRAATGRLLSDEEIDEYNILVVKYQELISR